jgi:hypothetical protein
LKTAICFKFSYFDHEYFKQLQSSELLHAKKASNPPACSVHGLHVLKPQWFPGTVLQKCGRASNCSLDCGLQVKNSPSFRNPNQNGAALWRIFSSNESAPANRKTEFYADRDPHKKEVRLIFA